MLDINYLYEKFLEKTTEKPANNEKDFLQMVQRMRQVGWINDQEKAELELNKKKYIPKGLVK